VSRISLLLVCVLAALAQPPEKVVMSGSADLRSGGVLYFRSVLRPPGTSMKGYSPVSEWPIAPHCEKE